MMFQPQTFWSYVRNIPLGAVIGAAVVATACNGGEAAVPAGGPGGGAPMAMGVEVVTLAPKAVERSTEYVATVKSRRSTTIQPQVEGFVTAIMARPGQRVGAGAPLMQIDSGRQQAAVASLQSVRAAREADMKFAQQQAERMKKLFDAGAVSQQEYEQAATAVQTTEAQLRAMDAQIREQQVELGYHRVTSPTAGMVGDIPVRIGDRVTRQTVLTTVDENAGLELYINVPVAQATGLKPGLLVRVVDDSGQPIATSEVNFVSPSVDPSTQSVLVKAPLQSNAPFRTDQFVRTHLVWSNEPGLTVPLVAVSRVNGQYFVYVAEKGDGGMLVARQRAVQLGPIVGNDYVVLGGVKDGDQLIVSGVQKIGDGVPVNVQQAGK
jgi:RND family efflux transporter MFP subunit